MKSKIEKMKCIISKHENGFWCADVYGEDDQIPTWFATCKKGDGRYGVINKANKAFPGIEFIAGVTGLCDECGEEYTEMETHCDCGEPLKEPNES